MKTKNEINNYEPNVVSDVTPKEKKKLNKKHKIIIAVCLAILAIILIIGTWYLVERNANKWELRNDVTTIMAIEYGEEVSELSIEHFVDINKYPNVTSDNTTIKINATYEIDMNNENKSYYAVGDYDIDVIHKIEYKLFGLTLFSMDDTKKVSLIVRDTKAPVFDENTPNEIEVYKNCEIENIEETFKATDLSSVTITIDKENIDFAKVGEYTTNVYATDNSGNVTNKEIKVKVIEPSITLDKTSLELTVGDTSTITATIKGKSQNVEWSSSDESIAKIDNGNIITNKAGKVTIKAKANDVEATCEITVNEKVVASSNNNSSTRNNNSSTSNNNNGSSSRPSSNGSSGNNGNNSSSNNGGGSSSNSNQHTASVGNIGKWFSNRNEVENYWKQVDTNYFSQYESGIMSYEEYSKKSPYGYECWSCSHCGKWTGNFKYR